MFFVVEMMLLPTTILALSLAFEAVATDTSCSSYWFGVSSTTASIFRVEVETNSEIRFSVFEDDWSEVLAFSTREPAQNTGSLTMLSRALPSPKGFALLRSDGVYSIDVSTGALEVLDLPDQLTQERSTSTQRPNRFFAPSPFYDGVSGSKFVWTDPTSSNLIIVDLKTSTTQLISTEELNSGLPGTRLIYDGRSGRLQYEVQTISPSRMIIHSLDEGSRELESEHSLSAGRPTFFPVGDDRLSNGYVLASRRPTIEGLNPFTWSFERRSTETLPALIENLLLAPDEIIVSTGYSDLLDEFLWLGIENEETGITRYLSEDVELASYLAELGEDSAMGPLYLLSTSNDRRTLLVGDIGPFGNPLNVIAIDRRARTWNSTLLCQSGPHQ